jgi:endo-1,3(4)-beta-glucanase
LLATEIQSVQHYWHLYPNVTSETTYPEQVFRDFVTVGNVEDQQAGPWLYVSNTLIFFHFKLMSIHSFWGDQKSEIAGIEMLPFTPITEYVIDVEWGRAMYNYTSVEFSDAAVGDDWKNLIYMAQAVWDAKAAFAEAETTTTWGTGNSYLNSLWFVATRGAGGGSVGSVCAGAFVTGVDIDSGLLYSKSADAYVVVGSYNDAYVAYSISPSLRTLFVISFIISSQ